MATELQCSSARFPSFPSHSAPALDSNRGLAVCIVREVMAAKSTSNNSNTDEKKEERDTVTETAAARSG
jgi:hypothetical protein